MLLQYLILAINTKQTFEFNSDGTINVNYDAKAYGPTPGPMPKIGSELKVNNNFQNVKYYGLGPKENYLDSKASAYKGIFKTEADELFENYPFPQDNGNHMETKWVSLNDGETEITIIGDNLNFSVWNYSKEQIQKVTHRHLLEKEDEVTLNIDYMVMGLGSRSCGSEVAEPFLPLMKDYEFNYKIIIKDEILSDKIKFGLGGE